jgi:protein-disulfide isomerase
MIRRSVLALVPVGATALMLARSGVASAQDAAKTVSALDSAKAERSIGKADAKTTVIEFFSLTCTHCAAFSTTTMPRVKQELVDTGKVRFIYHDFPLDQIALTAAMVARYLPVDRYDPFITALLASQDRWVFARGIEPTTELWKMAALAGMSRATFDKAIADDALRTWLLQTQKDDAARWKIDSTPSFVVDGQRYSGAMTFDTLRKLIPDS